MQDFIPFPKDPHFYALEKPVEGIPTNEYSFEVDVNKHLIEKTEEWTPQLLDKKKPVSIEPYLPSQKAREVIELAQILNRPILLQGEPGSGKTKLAQAVAFDWYQAEYKSKYFEWHIKSSSKAVEGLYTFDHVARLRDATLNNPEIKNTGDLLNDHSRYFKLGPLAKAFLVSTKEAPAILLIDEIDKADIDFPNDLLLEIDESRSRIQEPGIFDFDIEASAPPLIFITSNQEKDLPAAFLRRCLYLYFQFPGESLLKKIISARHPMLEEQHEGIIDLLISRFKTLRKAMEENPGVDRVVSTSEFLDWIMAIRYHLSKLDSEDKEEVVKKLQFSSTLLKSINELKMEKLFSSDQ